MVNLRFWRLAPGVAAETAKTLGSDFRVVDENVITTATPAAAKERHVAFSQEVRLRLTKANQSLAGYMADFERNVRDVIEHNVRNSKDIEATWRRLADLRTKIAHFQTGVEEVLLPYLQDPKVRELVRGTPQEREKGGKS